MRTWQSWKITHLSSTLLLCIICVISTHSFNTIAPKKAFTKRHHNHEPLLLFAANPSYYYDCYAPPPSIANITIGLQGHETTRQRTVSDHQYTVERISNNPHAFILRNFLTRKECQDISSQAESIGMTAAETRTEEGAGARQACDVAWLPYFSSSSPASSSNDDDNKDQLGSILEKEIRSLLIQNNKNNKSTSLFAEYLQVLKYQKGGMYEIHHDGYPRFLTIIYYLNGIGATWFPFATLDDGYDPCDLLRASSHELRRQFAQVRQGVEGVSMNIEDEDELQPGIHGVVIASRSSLEEEDIYMSNGRIVPMDQGDVLAFYNFECHDDVDVYDDDSNGRDSGTGGTTAFKPRENWRALHAGLPAEEEKMIANHWFRFVSKDEVK